MLSSTYSGLSGLQPVLPQTGTPTICALIRSDQVLPGRPHFCMKYLGEGYRQTPVLRKCPEPRIISALEAGMPTSPRVTVATCVGNSVAAAADEDPPQSSNRGCPCGRVKANWMKSFHVTFTLRYGNAYLSTSVAEISQPLSVKYLVIHPDRKWRYHLTAKRKQGQPVFRKLFRVIRCSREPATVSSFTRPSCPAPRPVVRARKSWGGISLGPNLTLPMARGSSRRRSYGMAWYCYR